jgi:hypothetical protein
VCGGVCREERDPEKVKQKDRGRMCVGKRDRLVLEVCFRERGGERERERETNK